MPVPCLTVFFPSGQWVSMNNVNATNGAPNRPGLVTARRSKLMLTIYVLKRYLIRILLVPSGNSCRLQQVGEVAKARVNVMSVQMSGIPRHVRRQKLVDSDVYMHEILGWDLYGIQLRGGFLNHAAGLRTARWVLALEQTPQFAARGGR
jgi:hypothetical protein